MQRQLPSLKNARYYFSRMKDTHTENGQTFITLYVRLTIEFPGKSECLWAEVEEIVRNQATHKLQNTPDGIYMYQVPEGVFRDLERLSRDKYKALYSITPFCHKIRFKRLRSHWDIAN